MQLPVEDDDINIDMINLDDERMVRVHKMTPGGASGTGRISGMSS